MATNRNTTTLKKFFSLFSILFLIAFSFAQTDELSPNSQFKSHTYDIDWPLRSPDGKYFTVMKQYESSSDTLVLISPNHPEKVIFQSGDVTDSSQKYSEKGYLFMSGISTAKLLKLPDLKPIIWTEITEAFFMQRYNRIAIQKDDFLRIYNEDGVLEEEIKDVIKVEEKDKRLFYTNKSGAESTLIEWTPNDQVTIFSGPSISLAISYVDDQKFILQSIKDGTKIPEIYFVDTATKSKVKLEDTAMHSLTSLLYVSKLPNGNYFLMTGTSEPLVKKTSDVDIWYANDNNLEKKYYPNKDAQFLLWNPLGGKTVALDHSRFNKYINSANGRFLLTENSILNQNYIKERIQSEMYRYDTETGEIDYLGVTGLYKIFDKSGKFLLSYDNQNWVLYNIETKKKDMIKLERMIDPYFSTSGDRILFPGKGFIAEYDIKKSKLTKIPLAKDEEAFVVTGSSEGVGYESFYSNSYYDPDKPLLIKVRNQQQLTNAYFSYQKSKLTEVAKASHFGLTRPSLLKDGKTFLYVKELYNIPPMLVLNTKGKEQAVYRSNPNDRRIKDYRLERITYTNTKGIPLTGLLYYPRQFDQDKKYPMVVGIYEILRYHYGRYLRDGFKGLQLEGLNIRHYIDKGYFVFLPDIVFDERGTGRSALDCVESSLDALEKNSNIDFKKVGLVGHSHGGYETNFIATQSKRFASYVAGAGNADLVRSYNSFNYDFMRPFYWQFEEQQYRMFKPFSEAKELYIDNSPVYHAEKVGSPILLWTGTKDENIRWEQTMEFYMSLRRNNKKVVALFYEGDYHNLIKKVNREDLYVRISEWFDYHLKGEKKDWIDVMYKKDI